VSPKTNSLPCKCSSRGRLLFFVQILFCTIQNLEKDVHAVPHAGVEVGLGAFDVIM